MLEYSAIIEAVGALGFPIVATCVLFWYLNKERESHQEEIKSVTTALNENTKVLIELQTFIKIITEVKKDGNG